MVEGEVGRPDVVGLALVEGAHQALQLLPEAGAHTVQLVCALATPGGRGHCCAVHLISVLKETPATHSEPCIHSVQQHW